MTDQGGTWGERRSGVAFAIDEREMPAFDYAGPRIVGPSNYWLVNAPVTPDWEPIPGGEPTLELYLDATDPENAQRQAEDLYARLREEGGLPRSKPRVVGLFIVDGTDPAWLRHFDEAQDMIEQQRYELAVVSAQIACEIEVKAAIESVADAPEGSLARMAIDAPRSYSLIDPRARDVFRAVVCATPTEQRFWQEYRDHVERRNNVVHRGARVTRPEALSSVQVSEEMVDWIQRTRAR